MLHNWRYLFSVFHELENVGQLLLWLCILILNIPLSIFIPFELLCSIPLKRGGRNGS